MRAARLMLSGSAGVAAAALGAVGGLLAGLLVSAHPLSAEGAKKAGRERPAPAANAGNLVGHGGPVRTIVAEAGNGEEAIRLVRSHRPDVILMDVSMPGIGGLELLEGLQCNPVPTILLTRQSDIPVAVRAMRAGAVDFIEKPFTEAILVDLIRHVVKGSDRPH